jgi:hypothetical protein
MQHFITLGRTLLGEKYVAQKKEEDRNTKYKLGLSCAKFRLNWVTVLRLLRVSSYPLLSQAPTPVEVELGCDNLAQLSWNRG